MLCGCIKYLFRSTQCRIQRCGTSDNREQKVALDFDINLQGQQAPSLNPLYQVYGPHNLFYLVLELLRNILDL